MLFRTGAIYSLYYSRWKQNRKIYAFVLYGGLGSTKLHALNLGAKELNVAGRIRLINVITKLAKNQGAHQWDGSILYRIFKTYLPYEIKQCYRTYFKDQIPQLALVNYGLNDKDDFDPAELIQTNKSLFEAANKEMFIKMFNLYSNRGVKMEAVKDSFATPEETGVSGDTPPNVLSEDTEEIVENIEDNEEIEEDNDNDDDNGDDNDSGIDGYY